MMVPFLFHSCTPSSANLNDCCTLHRLLMRYTCFCAQPCCCFMSIAYLCLPSTIFTHTWFHLEQYPRLPPPKKTIHTKQQEFSKQLGKLDENWAKSLNHACQLCQGQTCTLCGDKCLKLEPPVIICQHCNKRVVRGGNERPEEMSEHERVFRAKNNPPHPPNPRLSSRVSRSTTDPSARAK